MKLRSQMLRRLMAGGLSLAMAMSMCPSTVFAAEEATTSEEAVVEEAAEDTAAEETIEEESASVEAEVEEAAEEEETLTVEETAEEDVTEETMEVEGDTVTVSEDSSDKLIIIEEDVGVYVLMNLPYSVIYGAEGASVADVDAVSSATNKTGNYGFAGGGYHSQTTASIAEDGTVTAVGGENGSQMQGATVAVCAASVDEIKALGGTEITADSKVTTATLGRGASSYQELVGYEALTEAPAYSYYVLDSAPSYYLMYEDGQFTAAKNAVDAGEATASVTYGSNWGDVQMNLTAADVSDKLVNAVILTAQDAEGNETKVGLYHLDQIWQNIELAWKVDATAGLDGKTITAVRYYCSVKDTDLTDGEAPAYQNYVYDYTMNQSICKVYTGEAQATFDSEKSISVSGLPSDVQNLKAKVYYTTGGRGATYTYMTPVAVDPADDDIDPVTVDVVNGKIAIEAGSVTNNAGTTVEYGSPVVGTSYTVELSSDNYIFRKISVTYKDAQTITVASAYNKKYGDKAFALNAKAEGTLSYASSNSKVATVNANGVVTIKGAGTAVITVTAAETDTLRKATKKVTIKVAKASQTVTAKKVSKSLKKAALKKKASAFATKATAKTTVSYKVAKYANKKAKKYLSINKKTGKVTVKKGTPKGTYKMTVKATAAATANYNAASKSYTVTVKVK